MVRLAVQLVAFAVLFGVAIPQAAAQTEDLPLPVPNLLGTPGDVWLFGPIAQQLARRVNFDGWNDPKLTLADALVVLGKTYKLDFSIDEGAFHREHCVGATRQLLVRTPIPAMQGVPLAEVLGEVFARVPVPAGATFIIDGRCIRVTTRRQAVEDGWISVRQLLHSSAYRVRFFLWTDIQRNGIGVVGLYGIDAARLLGAITYWSCVMSDNTKAIADESKVSSSGELKRGPINPERK